MKIADELRERVTIAKMNEQEEFDQAVNIQFNSVIEACMKEACKGKECIVFPCPANRSLVAALIKKLEDEGLCCKAIPPCRLHGGLSPIANVIVSWKKKN